ncbi:hypothetical protein CHS0354_008331 [Potamilus streckersoni]|uniref:Uncharacterized protein n=1 Tax=Potamilus streckersoni TaxID=2493646 RepID=A0AAE0SC10_9BIVA|nr:hypothetical protein CHS0354_008331 [Potamilus streckersoni]
MLEEEEERSLVEGVQEVSLLEGVEEGRLLERVQEVSLVGVDEELQGKGEEEEFQDHQLAGQLKLNMTFFLFYPFTVSFYIKTYKSIIFLWSLLFSIMLNSFFLETHSQYETGRKRQPFGSIWQKHPNMVFEVLNCSSTEQQGCHPRPGGESPSWCICSNCREMPNDEEKYCCKQIPPNCYSRLPVKSCSLFHRGIGRMSCQQRKIMITTGGKGMRLIGNLFYGLTDTLVLGIDVSFQSFQAVLYGL